ncbi:MAG: leucine-rich repeat protein [Ruminococcus sp.]|nr:leucine-rich repeat protein [Ruminococcus sp.]
MRMKKILAVAIAFAVVSGGTAPFAAEMPEFSLTANAEDAVFEKLRYIIEDDHVVITGHTKDFPAELVIPPEIEGKPVTSIGGGAFRECSELISITIPEGVTSIGNWAFEYCSGLTGITIPEGVISIGDEAFKSCSKLTSITIPEGVISIGGGAFYDTPWLEAKQKEDPLVIINSILIDGRTCTGEVEIPEGVTSIGDYAFNGCSKLTSITIPEGVISIGGGAFFFCTGLTNTTIPESVTSVGARAFSYCTELTSITIPESVTSIGGGAFWNCAGLTSITIPEGVTSIGVLAFDGCSELTISGYTGSYAETYAKNNNIPFVSLGESSASSLGDVNEDSKIDANDATLVLVNYSLLSTGEPIQLTEVQQKAADVNGDGKIDSSDATTILQYYSYLSTGGTDSFADFMASQK